ncbi:hypothetical protein O6H91_17G008400 [Diphasiastrum complanatum]|uniref:Uncharacterized protein n=1 Tax=Diphasiastrum complanatum TaxID=34168 RepID=A0ACC2B430_DIPCM|nr:hypothetical protein O6H91_17G008400 [Diphasiastrum complanatum]
MPTAPYHAFVATSLIPVPCGDCIARAHVPPVPGAISQGERGLALAPKCTAWVDGRSLGSSARAHANAPGVQVAANDAPVPVRVRALVQRKPRHLPGCSGLLRTARGQYPDGGRHRPRLGRARAPCPTAPGAPPRGTAGVGGHCPSAASAAAASNWARLGPVPGVAQLVLVAMGSEALRGRAAVPLRSAARACKPDAKATLDNLHDLVPSPSRRCRRGTGAPRVRAPVPLARWDLHPWRCTGARCQRWTPRARALAAGAGPLAQDSQSRARFRRWTPGATQPSARAASVGTSRSRATGAGPLAQLGQARARCLNRNPRATQSDARVLPACCKATFTSFTSGAIGANYVPGASNAPAAPGAIVTRIQPAPSSYG